MGEGGPAISAGSDTPHFHLARKHFPSSAIYGVFFLLMEFMEYNRCPEPPSPQAPLTCTTTGKRERGARVEAMSAERVFTTVLFYLIMRFSKYIQNCSLKLKSCGGDNSKAPISLNLSRLENSVNLLWRRISTHSIQSTENRGVFPVVWKVPTGLYVQNWRGSINTDVTIVIE